MGHDSDNDLSHHSDKQPNKHYDWIIIGSGFGGSVSALRLAQKGYRVLVLEKGRRFAPEDFPKSNWDLKKWFWKPKLGLRGIFQMSFFDHVTVLHGVGVGGGSLVYANTLPTPSDSFFNAASWSHLAHWKQELLPHYQTAKRMLGTTQNPRRTLGDDVLYDIAKDLGREAHFALTEVAVFFGPPGKKVPDPYFEGEGPERVGCTHCGACMTGCRVGAKNTLDQNYLYLAEKLGVTVLPETEVTAVRLRSAGSADSAGNTSQATTGYQVETKRSFGAKKTTHYTADRVIFAGGVMGSVPLLLRMREDPQALPNLSPCLGNAVRTNNESLIAVGSSDPSKDFSKGVAITSILHTDPHSHVEPVRYGKGSSFFRLLSAPHAPGPTVFVRIFGACRSFLSKPLRWLKVLTSRRFAAQSQILLYMRTLESTLRLQLGRGVFNGFQKGLVTKLDNPDQAPQAFIAEATDIAERFADKVNGVSMTLMTETLLGTPSTAHILGGCCMGDSAQTGVINSEHHVFGYPGLYVIDGSAISANPGVNPSLTITALAERAMSFIPEKASATNSNSNSNKDTSL